MTQQHYEVLIVGGGMTGAACACLLGMNGIRVALLDASKVSENWPAHSVDNRVSALTLASENILRNIGIWPDLLDMGVCAYQQMRVWDSAGDGEVHFDCAETHYDHLGHIVENRITVAALHRKLEQLASVSIFSPEKVLDIQRLQQGWQVVTEQGLTLTTELLIAADGANSYLRQAAGIPVTGWSYQQHGLVATVDTSENHDHTARQRFLDQGPIAFLPLYTGQSSIVWTLNDATAKEYMVQSDEEFINHLQAASKHMLGDILAVQSRAIFPLRFQYANSYISDFFAVIGDAAHVMHPLAGQGANAGLLDAAAIAELIVTAKQQNRPIGTHRLLRKYERWRKGDNLIMMSAMDVLNKTYQLSNPMLSGIRSFGMQGVNKHRWVKNYLNDYAMGVRDDLPRCAQR